MKDEELLDFDKILPFKLPAESPINENVPARDLFDLRAEITAQIPAMDVCAGVLFYKIS